MQAAIFAGDLAGTVVGIDTMLEVPLNVLTRQRLLYDRGLALAFLGHVDEAERTLSEAHGIATDDFDGRGSVLWCWAEACFWGGQPARARELADASLAFTAFNEAEFVLPSLVRAWAEVELGNEPSPLAGRGEFRFLAAAEPEHRGLIAVARGEHLRAVDAFEEAARLWAGFNIPRELLCRSAGADALERAGQRDVAVERLRAVEAEATAIGFAPLVARVRRSLRLAGERPASSASARRSGGLLTGREREILGLVERGLTNAEIARRMALGRPTVARMISNAMAKLGAESRAQAVVLAAQVT
jgi:DNA-binding CsgD family transcriptional regulator